VEQHRCARERQDDTLRVNRCRSPPVHLLALDILSQVLGRAPHMSPAMKTGQEGEEPNAIEAGPVPPD